MPNFLQKMKLFRRKKLPPVNDPLKDSNEKFGTEFHRIPSRSVFPAEDSRETSEKWEKFETFYTTGRFSRQGKGYVQHCGPTAITNVLCTLNNRYGYPKVAEETPEEIFRHVAAIGTRRLFYINKKILRYWGGSSIWFISLYFRICLKKYGIRDRKVRFRLLSSSKKAAADLSEGKLLLLQVYFHRIYGSHVVTAYGLENLQSADGRIRTYLKLADGWSDRPRYLSIDDTRILGYCAIS